MTVAAKTSSKRKYEGDSSGIEEGDTKRLKPTEEMSQDEDEFNNQMDEIEKKVEREPVSDTSLLFSYDTIMNDYQSLERLLGEVEKLKEEGEIVIDTPMQNLIYNNIDEAKQNVKKLAKSVQPKSRVAEGNYRKICFAGPTGAGKTLIFNCYALSELRDSSLYDVSELKELVNETKFTGDHVTCSIPFLSSFVESDSKSTSNSVTHFLSVIRFSEQVSVRVELYSKDELLEMKSQAQLMNEEDFVRGFTEVQEVFKAAQKPTPTDGDYGYYVLYDTPTDTTEPKMSLLKELKNATDSYRELCYRYKNYVKRVIVYGPFHFLNEDWEMVDSPGLTDPTHIVASVNYMRNCDIIVYVARGRTCIEDYEVESLESVWNYEKFIEMFDKIPHTIGIINASHCTSYEEWCKRWTQILSEQDKAEMLLKSKFRELLPKGTICGSIQGLYRERLFDFLEKKSHAFSFFGQSRICELKQRDQVIDPQLSNNLFCCMASFKRLMKEIMKERDHNDLRQAFSSLQYISYTLWDMLKRVQTTNFRKNVPKQAINSLFGMKGTTTECTQLFIDDTKNRITEGEPHTLFISQQDATNVSNRRDSLKRHVTKVLLTYFKNWIEVPFVIALYRSFVFFRIYLNKNESIRKYKKEDWIEQLDSRVYMEEWDQYDAASRYEGTKLKTALPTNRVLAQKHQSGPNALLTYLYRYVYNCTTSYSNQMREELVTLVGQIVEKLFKYSGCKESVTNFLNQDSATNAHARLDTTNILRQLVDALASITYNIPGYNSNELSDKLFGSGKMLASTKLRVTQLCECMSEFTKGKGKMKRKKQVQKESASKLLYDICHKKKYFDDYFQRQHDDSNEGQDIQQFSFRNRLTFPAKLLTANERMKKVKTDCAITTNHHNFDSTIIDSTPFTLSDQNAIAVKKIIIQMKQDSQLFEIQAYKESLKDLEYVLSQPQDSAIVPIFIPTKGRYSNKQAVLYFPEDITFKANYIVYVFIEEQEVDEYLNAFNYFKDKPSQCTLVIVSIPGKSRGVKFVRSLIVLLQQVLRKEMMKRGIQFDYWVQMDDDLVETRVWNTADRHCMQKCSLLLALNYAQEALKYQVNQNDGRIQNGQLSEKLTDILTSENSGLIEFLKKEGKSFSFACCNLGRLPAKQIIDHLDSHEPWKIYENMGCVHILSDSEKNRIILASEEIKKSTACRITQIAFTTRLTTVQSNYNIAYHKEAAHMRVSDQRYACVVNYTPALIGYNYIDNWSDMFQQQEAVNRLREEQRNRDEGNQFLGEDKGIISRTNSDNRTGFVLYNFDIQFSARKNGGCEQFRPTHLTSYTVQPTRWQS